MYYYIDFLAIIRREGRLNYPLLYFHRYLRLTPLFAVCIVVSMTIFRYFGTGPLWPFYNYMAVEESCRKYWWSALLYIQNYYNPDEMVRFDFQNNANGELFNYYSFAFLFSSVFGTLMVLVSGYATIYCVAANYLFALEIQT